MLYIVLALCVLAALGVYAWIQWPDFSPDRVRLEQEQAIVNGPAWGGRREQRVQFGGDVWRAWLDKQKCVRLTTERGDYVYLQREQRHGRYYWYGYRWSEHGTQASRCYVGKLESMSVAELSAKIHVLNQNEAERRAARAAERERRRKLAKAEYDRQRRRRIAERKAQERQDS